MDERHWWFAAKLQETFHFGGYDNPTLLEDFLSESDVVDSINSFLSPGQPNKIFFYCDAVPSSCSQTPGPNHSLHLTGSSNRQLHVTSKLTTDVISQGCVCLYVLRKDIHGEVDISQMEKELFCGELRHSVLSSLASLLAEAYTPLLHSQKKWGECSDERVTNFLQSFDKLSNTLLEASTRAHAEQPMLQWPSYELRNALHQTQPTAKMTSKGGTVFAEILMECEALVADWISTIESLLLETTDERLEDARSGPLAELAKWQRRQVVLTSVVEQLKIKECKTVLAALAVTKSRLLKKWKNIDMQITDAYNNARDRVRYLESLSPHLEALQASPPPTTNTVMTNILPALASAFRQMDGLSRVYARSGYLGVILTKISNSLIKLCTANLESFVTRQCKDSDHFWSMLSDAVLSEMNKPLSSSQSLTKKHDLIIILNSCLELSTAFKDYVQQLKEAFLQQVHLPFAAGGSVHRVSNASTASSIVNNRNSLPRGHLRQISESGSSSKRLSSTQVGIALSDVEQITNELGEFSTRVTKVLDIISTLSQFRQLNMHGKLEGLPRIAGLWELSVPTGSVGECSSGAMSQERSDTTSKRESPDVQITIVESEGVSKTGSESDITFATPDFLEQLVMRQKAIPQYTKGLGTYPLCSLKEESTTSSFKSCSTMSGLNEKGKPESQATSSTASSCLPAEEGDSNGHSNSPTDSVALMITVSSRDIQEKLEVACSGGVMDVFSTTGRHKAVFPVAYQEYSNKVTKLEDNICRYLKAVFAEIGTSKRALDIISRFEAVSSRAALKEALHKCMLTAFSRYSLELEEIQATYEKYKGSPPLSRNAPPIAGVVSWARQLLRRVEEPMEVFRSDSDVMQSVESHHICKSYNRLATVLLKYESLWLSQWRSSVRDNDRTCMKSPLLAHKRTPEGTSLIEVNCHNQLLVLLTESKALGHLGISIPDSAKSLLIQESRIKNFKQQLEYVLEDFYSVQRSIDPPLRPLLSPHIESVVRSLLPGWTTLTWNTMNIDVFLHRVQTSIASLRDLTDKVNAVLRERVYGVLPLIETTYLFDVKLATSRPWHPQEFLEVIMASVIERSNRLLKHIAVVHRALLDIVTLTCSSQIGDGTRSTDNTVHLISTPVKSKSHLTSMSNTSSREKKSAPVSTKGTPQRSPSRALSTSNKHISAANTMVHLATPTHGFTQLALNQLGSIGEQVLNHFCKLVSEAVVKAVLQSHGKFISSLGTDQYETAALTVTAQSCPDIGINDQKEEWQQTSKLSQVSAADSNTTPLLQLMVDVHFSTPRIQLDPPLDRVHSDLLEISEALLRVLHQAKWWANPNAGRSLYDLFGVGAKEEAMYSVIRKAIQNVSPGIKQELKDLQQYDFLWQQDLHSSYCQFLDSKPGDKECCLHVESLLQLEKDLGTIPDALPVGPLLLSTNPVKNSFKAWAVAWKIEFVSFLHKKGKSALESLVSAREAMVTQLHAPVDTLEQLKSTLELLHHITDLQNVIDKKYFPVENLYKLLRVYNPHLPRVEVQQVDSLRDEWEKLTGLADDVRHRLLSDERLHYEREVDKQVKMFVVETIQFRNSFDTEGPLVPGLLPSEAVSRLGSFLERCEELQKQHALLDAVQKLLDIPLTPYPELDQTEQDLSFLRALYTNYQNFIAFDKRFRQELWAEVDLEAAKEMVTGFWSTYESLPVEQKEWDASRKLRTEIEHYLKIFPLLKQLHSKEIRNRHWLQVMNVANCTFQLEGSIFKMAHLLDAGLLLHVPAIQDILHCARCELELEEQFYKVEEEWSEQVLTFQPYKPHGSSVLLNLDRTHSLIEQLEHTQIQLATMLKSKYIQPLKEEAAQWAAKLAAVSEILQKWLQVQELWHNLEVVFNTPTTSREFPEEAVKFASIHKRWLKLMKTTYQIKNVLQCCTGGDVPKSKLLSDIGQDLELCKKSLSTYLLSKRMVFPRFYFVSDDSLLSILSNSASVESVKPHLSSLFNDVGSIVSPGTSNGDVPLITGVESCDGEVLPLNQPVPLNSGAEQWMSDLLLSSQSTLHDLIIQAVELNDSPSFSLEECAHSSLTQVANMALYFRWTRECEQALVQCRYDRRALPGTKNKFNTWAISKISHLLMKNAWKVSDEPLSRVERIKLESLAMMSMWLRDILEDLCHQKLRDITDFEWQKYIRPQLLRSREEEGEGTDSEGGGKQTSDDQESHSLSSASISLHCLDQQLSYGFEYQGCSSLPVMTPRMDNYIIAFTQGIQSHLGSMLIGPAGSGKVQLIKGIGQLCGRFVLTIHCCSLTDKRAIARTFEGLAQAGCWASFSDVQGLSPSTVSTLSQMMQIITAALQSQREACTLPSGREITLNSNVAVFLTHTHPTSTPQWQLPPTVSPFFRTFSLPLPDPTVVFRAHCMALGLKASKMLANKLANLQTMARDQLSCGCRQANFSTSSLCHILKIASARKFVVQRTTGSSHLTSQTSDHVLNVKVSSTSHLPPRVSMAGHSPAHNMPESKMRRKQSVSNLTLSPGGGQQLPASVVKEQSLVSQLIISMIGARLPDKELPIFTSIVKDVFSGVELTSSAVGLKEPFMQDVLSASLPMAPTASTKLLSPPKLEFVSDLLKKQAAKINLVASPRWIAKVEQLFIQSQLKHALIVAGQPATGKTAALNTVVSTLNAIQGSDSSNIKLVRVYPDTYERLADLFGCVASPAGDWIDGIFTSIFRKAHKATQSVTWVCMDGAMSSPWMEFLPELLGQSKTLSLSNGEHLVMKEKNFKLLFETGNLDSASPASLLNCGILYFDCGVLGWRPVVEAWRATRTVQESQCLKKYFEQVMDPIVDFILNKAEQSTKYSEVGLLETCLAYLTTLLNTYTETAEVFSEVHVERLLLFSIIWSYGGVLIGEKGQKKFSHLLKTLTNSLPDDDSEFSVFDYYVDESGEWDVWQSRMPVNPVSQVDMLGRVYVDTTETIRVETLLELALASKRNVLLAGPHGGGKTTICRHFLQSRAMINGGTEILKQMVFNKTTSSDLLHNFMVVNFHHRQGYTYGPKHGRTMQWFIDDIHLPLTDGVSISNNTIPLPCCSHEYLRQLIDVKGLYNLEKMNEWCVVEDLVMFVSLTSSSDAVVEPRLRRHLATVHIPDLQDHNLGVVAFQQLAAILENTVNEDTLQKLVGSSIEVYRSVKQALSASNMPGRQHYCFSLRHLESVFQGLCQCAKVSGGLQDKTGYCWSHEMKRAFTDSLCRSHDREWLQYYIDSLSKKFLSTSTDQHPPTLPTDDDIDKDTYSVGVVDNLNSQGEATILALTAIPIEVKQGEEQPSSAASPLHTLPLVTLQPVNDWSDLKPSISHFIRRYQEEHGEQFSMDISTDGLKHLAKLHRALRFSRGNCIVVGCLGQPLESLAQIALYIAGYELQMLDSSSESKFNESFRALFRQTGLEGKALSIILTEKDLASPLVADTLNSVMSCGELPTLYTNDEIEGLLQALTPSIKRDFPSEETDPMQYFTARIYRNLRIVICLSPTSPLLHEQAHCYKGMVQNSQLIWMCDWTAESLNNTTNHFFSSSPLANVNIESKHRSSLYNCLAAIHHYLLQETSQLRQAGLQPGHFEQPDPLSPDTKTNDTTLPSITLCPPQVAEQHTSSHNDAPSSMQYLMEKVLDLDYLINGNDIPAKLKLPYLGPRTYLQFMECFCEIYKKKSSEAKRDRDNLTKVLETLQRTFIEAEQMKNTLKELRQKYENAGKLSNTLLAQLTAKSCQVERLKALLGQGSSVLSAIQMVREQERLLVENEDDDEELLAVSMDRKTSRLETLLQKARDQFQKAEAEEKDAKRYMLTEKEKAIRWQNKIDRNTIDQIKTLNNPPYLVGTIMELMLTLLWQYGSKGREVPPGDSSSSTPGHAATVNLLKKKSSMVSGSTRMEKDQWNAIQLAIGDSQKFLDLLNSLKWESGLSTDAVNLIKSRLAMDEESSGGGHTESSNSSRSSTGVKQSELITISMARYAAESAAHMCAFAVAIVKYNESFKPYMIAKEKFERAKHELDEIESSLYSDSSGQLKLLESGPKSEPPELDDVDEEAEVGEEGLTKVQAEVNSLQEQFDRAVIEKHSLGETCQLLAEKLKSVYHLLESLNARQESWQAKLQSLPSTETVMANCILAAAFTSCCGPLKTDSRLQVFDSLLAICKSCGFPPSNSEEDKENILTLEEYPKFMEGEPARYQLIMESLPPDATSMENACLITYNHSQSWPLIMDRSGMVEAWLHCRLKSPVVIKYNCPGFDNSLLKSVSEGTTLIVTQVDVTDLASNKLHMDILQSRSQLYLAKYTTKIEIDGNEVECNPDFKLYLVTSDHLSLVPPTLFSVVTVVEFQPKRKGVEELLLDSFLQLQNAKTYGDREDLRKELHSQLARIEEVERGLLELIAHQENEQIEEPKSIKAILTLNKAFEDAQESFKRALASYTKVNTVHLSMLRSLASQASVITDVVLAMGAILPAYRTSYNYIKTIFVEFVKQTGSHIQGDDALAKMTKLAYSHFSRGYFEKDRLLFSLMLTTEIEINAGRATKSERDFLVSPSPGNNFVIKGLLVQAGILMEIGNSIPALNFGRKPFDWMSDAQWQTLLMLASHFSWVHEILEKLGKDGKEAVWRTIGEGVAPEISDLTEGLGYRPLPMQQLLLMFAMRPERITQCAISFITTVLDSGLKQRKFNYYAPVEISYVAKSLRKEQIPLILYRDDPQILLSKLHNLANKFEVNLEVVSLHGSGVEEAEKAKIAIQQASKNRHWVLLNDFHTCAELLTELPTFLETLPPMENWRLWLSSIGDCDQLPVHLLCSAFKVVLDSPLSLRGNVLHSLSCTARDLITASTRPEWLPILHNMIMLHATLRLRKLAFNFAWAENYHWTLTHLMDMLTYLKREFKNSELTPPGTSGVKPISWYGLRYMITEVFYGSTITDPVDSFNFAALTEHWMHAGGPRRESGRYHIPSQFFTPKTKLSTLMLAIENASPPLAFTAELCGLHYTPIIKLGWKEYLFSLLAQLSDYLEQQSTCSYLHTPARKELQVNVRQPSVSNMSVQSTGHGSQSVRAPLAGQYIGVHTTRLPSFIPVPYQIADVTLAHIPSPVLRVMGSSPLLWSDLPLQSTIDKLIDSIPTAWKKEVLTERLKKLGPNSEFVLFMKAETSRMCECLNGIQESLHDLQGTISGTLGGNVLAESMHLVDLAFSLLLLKVPSHWINLVGSTAPPACWPLKDWVQDLVLRFVFLDRVLITGLPRTPTYWLGAFFNPSAFLSVIQQNVVKSLCCKTGAVEQYTIVGELTSRDKDHIRDPPPDGELFVYGAYLWGCGYEKATNLDLQDLAPKTQVPSMLPVLHLSVVPQISTTAAEVQIQSGTVNTNVTAGEFKGPHLHHCPCFMSNYGRNTMGETLFTLTVTNSEVTPLKWATRNLVCTLRPF